MMNKLAHDIATAAQIKMIKLASQPILDDLFIGATAVPLTGAGAVVDNSIAGLGGAALGGLAGLISGNEAGEWARKGANVGAGIGMGLNQLGGISKGLYVAKEAPLTGLGMIAGTTLGNLETYNALKQMNRAAAEKALYAAIKKKALTGARIGLGGAALLGGGYLVNKMLSPDEQIF